MLLRDFFVEKSAKFQVRQAANSAGSLANVSNERLMNVINIPSHMSILLSNVSLREPLDILQLAKGILSVSWSCDHGPVPKFVAANILKVRKKTVPIAGDSSRSARFCAISIKIPEGCKELLQITDDYYIPSFSFGLVPTSVFYEELHMNECHDESNDEKDIPADCSTTISPKRVKSSKCLARRREIQRQNRRKSGRPMWRKRRHNGEPNLISDDKSLRCLGFPKSKEKNHWTMQVSTSLSREMNISRSLTDGNRIVRYFATREDAKMYCLWSFVFAFSHLLDKNDKIVRSLFCIDGADHKREQTFPRLTGVKYFRIFYDSSCSSPVKRPFFNRNPYAVAVKYERGGIAHFLCSSSGKRRTDALFSMPPGVTLLTNPANGKEEAEKKWFDFVEIVTHKTGEERGFKEPRCPINVVLRGINSDLFEEPLSRVVDNASFQCYLYAKRNGLLNKPGWKTYLRHYDYSDQNEATATAIHTRTEGKLGESKPENGHEPNTATTTVQTSQVQNNALLPFKSDTRDSGSMCFRICDNANHVL